MSRRCHPVERKGAGFAEYVAVVAAAAFAALSLVVAVVEGRAAVVLCLSYFLCIFVFSFSSLLK